MSNVLEPLSLVDRIIGRWRLLFGFCPRCNSDAPNEYYCSVCKQFYRGDSKTTQPNNREAYPPNLATKALWWYSWLHPCFDSMQKDWESRQAGKLGLEPEDDD